MFSRKTIMATMAGATMIFAGAAMTSAPAMAGGWHGGGGHSGWHGSSFSHNFFPSYAFGYGNDFDGFRGKYFDRDRNRDRDRRDRRDRNERRGGQDNK